MRHVESHAGLEDRQRPRGCPPCAGIDTVNSAARLSDQCANAPRREHPSMIAGHRPIGNNKAEFPRWPRVGRRGRLDVLGAPLRLRRQFDRFVSGANGCRSWPAAAAARRPPVRKGAGPSENGFRPRQKYNPMQAMVPDTVSSTKLHRRHVGTERPIGDQDACIVRRV